ncbi:MAG: hypothetical protein VW907_09195 [Opitutae bacterium]
MSESIPSPTRGRPTGSTKPDTLNAVIRVRTTLARKGRINAAARKLGKSLSEFILNHLPK